MRPGTNAPLSGLVRRHRGTWERADQGIYPETTIGARPWPARAGGCESRRGSRGETVAGTSESVGTMQFRPSVDGRLRWRVPDERRTLQLVLATIWLFDGVLQLQPVMFTRHFGTQRRAPMAHGNPTPVAHSVLWASRIIADPAGGTDAAFAAIQILLGLGIAWRPTVKVALAASIGWSCLVWWFGEGLGGVLTSASSTVGGAPRGCLALRRHRRAPVAGRPGRLRALVPGRPSGGRRSGPGDLDRAVGRIGAVRPGGSQPVRRRAGPAGAGPGPGRAGVVGHSRPPRRQRDRAPRPGRVDRARRRLGRHHRPRRLPAVAPGLRRRSVVAVALGFLVVWVLGQNFGLLFSGGATDPNSGPLLALVAAAYWRRRPVSETRAAPSPHLVTESGVARYPVAATHPLVGIFLRRRHGGGVALLRRVAHRGPGTEPSRRNH